MTSSLPRVVLATPSLAGPTAPYSRALPPAAKYLKDAGYDVGYVQEIGCPYISCARATMLRKALDAKAEVVVFIDHDLSFDEDALLKLVRAEGDVVAGLYRFKEDPEHYMGVLVDGPQRRPVVRGDGAIKGHRVPGGFLKVTAAAVDRFMTAYPELCYGPKFQLSVDLFNHGAYQGQWWGEDYAFSRRWIDAGGEIWIVPDLNLHHHAGDVIFRGNFHQFMLRQPGGSLDPNRKAA